MVLHLLEYRLSSGFYMLQDLDVTLSIALSESVSLFKLKKRRVELADAFRKVRVSKLVVQVMDPSGWYSSRHLVAVFLICSIPDR